MSKAKSGLTQRVITAVIILALTLLSYYYFQNIGVLAIGFIMVSLAAIEYANMHFKTEFNRSYLLAIYLVANLFTLFSVVYAFFTPIVLPMIFVSSIVLSIWCLRNESQNEQQLKVIGDLTIGLIYMGLFSGLGLRLLKFPDTQKWFWLLVIAVSIGDIGAYFVGKAVGKRHLYKSMSPNKTWAGFVGAIFLTTAVCAGFQMLILPSQPLWPFIVLGPAISIGAQTGDLFESLLKRVAGVKDSGKLLPGHGGALDRIDGHLFAAPIVYFTHFFLS